MSNKLLTLGAVAAAAMMSVPATAGATTLTAASAVEMDDFGRPTIAGQTFEATAAVAPKKPPVQNGNCSCSNTICW